MSRIRCRDTGPELTARRELHRRGFRFRANVAGLTGTPDIYCADTGLAFF